MLSVNNIEVLYDRVILVLKGVSLTVPRGGIVALLGANGAGKTTTLKAISNLLRAERGEVAKGTILFDGVEVQALSPNELVRRGCIQVMEGRHCFAHLTIEENLLTGAFTRRDGRAAIRRDLDLVYGMGGQSGSHNGDRVDAKGNILKGKSALACRCGSVVDAGRGFGSLHLRVRDNSARRIGHRPGDGAAKRLCIRHHC